MPHKKYFEKIYLYILGNISTHNFFITFKERRRDRPNLRWFFLFRYQPQILSQKEIK